jgi:hypothetical protein
MATSFAKAWNSSSRDEVRLAVDLHEHADLPAGVYVGGDGPFRGFSADFFRRFRHALYFQYLDGLVEVP